MDKATKATLLDPLYDKNPITLQVLGDLLGAGGDDQARDRARDERGADLRAGQFSNTIISMLRNKIPGSIRIITQLAVIASLVIVADQFLKAFVYDTSKQLSVFVGLIITNCIVMGRAEAFAMKNGPVVGFLDGLRQRPGLQRRADLRRAVPRAVRLGHAARLPGLPLVKDGGWYEPTA